MDKEKGLKNISIMAKRITDKGKKYKELEKDILEETKEDGCSIDKLRLNMKYPEFER